MTKKRSSEILEFENRNIFGFCWKGEFGKKFQIFWNSGESETWGNATLPQRRWTPLKLWP